MQQLASAIAAAGFDQVVVAQVTVLSVVFEARLDGANVMVKLAHPGGQEADGTHTVGWAAISGGVVPWRPDTATVLRRQAQSLMDDTSGLFPRVRKCGEVAVGGRALPYVASDRVEGESLRDARADFGVLATLACRLRGRAHGDLKPDNIIKTPGGELRLIDPTAGSNAYDEAGAPVRFLLTPAYAPRLVPDDATALAMIAVEMACGTLPLFQRRSPQSPTFTTRARRSLDVQHSLGRGAWLEQALAGPWPSQLRHGLDEVWDALYLSSLGFCRVGGCVDLADECLTMGGLATFLDGRGVAFEESPTVERPYRSRLRRKAVGSDGPPRTGAADSPSPARESNVSVARSGFSLRPKRSS